MPASRTPVRNRLAVAARWLPHGQTLPESAWRVRHRAVTVLLVVHAVVIGASSLAAGVPGVEMAVGVAVPALGAFAASRGSLSRGVRSGIAAVSLMLTSGVVVSLMGGSIEGHFHFFVMIPVVALYESWIPFSLAVGVVLTHHGVMGTLDPHAVYDHRSAWEHPWRWAFVHAGFFASACVGALVNWRLHERARHAEEELTAHVRHQAHHDALTGLPNRSALLIDGAELLAARGAGSGPGVAVLLLDLDGFKEVNDVLGHASGDELLTRLGPIMAAALPEGGRLYRLGGDEFVALLDGVYELEAAAVAGQMLALMSETMEVDGVALNVDASVGIAVSADGATDVDTLVRHADIAMYSAKRDRCGFTVYRGDQHAATRERLNLLGEMRSGLQNGEFVLHYQPKVSLSDRRLIGVEALARWQHPVRGLIPPGDFIPVAENTGLIVPLTLHLLESALAQSSLWQAAGRSFPIAVNLSPRCLADGDLTEKVLGLLDTHGVSPSLLALEITENTLAHDPERALATLTALHEAGISLSIDDFGTGYSSMSYLKRLPVSELKVDRSFVSGMLTNADDLVLVRSVVDLGHNLGLTVVAEGVEDEETLEALTRIGCDVAQGFHLGRPMTVEALSHWTVPRQRAWVGAPA